jgi:uncharacterized protein (TIGR00645 family)
MTERRTPSARLGRALFASRWLLAPFYVGLVASLGLLLAIFAVSLPQQMLRLLGMPVDKLSEAGTLIALSLIDLSLTANLVVIVIVSGFENFIAPIDVADCGDRPAWMGAIDYGDIKMKVIGSIAAISAIALLRTYLELGDHPLAPATLLWQVVICLTFVVLGLLLAAMDWLASLTGH